MSNVRLSDEEIAKATKDMCEVCLGDSGLLDCPLEMYEEKECKSPLRAIALAQARKMYEWWESPCVEHSRTCSDEDGCPTEYEFQHRYLCPECQQSVKEKLGL